MLTDAVKNTLGKTDYQVWLSWIATTEDDQLEISQNRFFTSRKNNAFNNGLTLAVNNNYWSCCSVRRIVEHTVCRAAV